MVSPFEIVAERLGELGVYTFLLPWLLTSAIVWGLLQKSKIFGEDAVVINSVISISISFFIWGFIIFSGGTDIGSSLSKFFTQMIFVAVGFTVILIVGSLFFPDFPAALAEKIPKSTMFWIIVVIGLILAIGAGLINLGGAIFDLINSITNVPGGDIGILIVSVIVLLLLIMLVGIS